ncbi:hypothetical protein BC835DRAFT_1522213 [Cytidiella melzeri]|nr:hypothetical protein BC835DRAFT_1522213 [Cytidiella melzeri]
MKQLTTKFRVRQPVPVLRPPPDYILSDADDYARFRRERLGLPDRTDRWIASAVEVCGRDIAVDAKCIPGRLARCLLTVERVVGQVDGAFIDPDMFTLYTNAIVSSKLPSLREGEHVGPRVILDHTTNVDVMNMNKQLVNDLLQPDESPCFANRESFAHRSTPRNLFRSSLILSIIKLWLWDKKKHPLGITHREFFDDDRALALPVLAMAITSIHYSLDQWTDGYERVPSRKGIKHSEHEKSADPFSEALYHQKYLKHLENLEGWHAHTASGSKAARKYQQELLAECLEHAGISDVNATDDGAPHKRRRLTAADYEADE